MDITVNGEAVRLEEPATVAQLVERQGYRDQLVAVELNGAIVPKRTYGQVEVHDRDAVEIVCFVGGG